MKYNIQYLKGGAKDAEINDLPPPTPKLIHQDAERTLHNMEEYNSLLATNVELGEYVVQTNCFNQNNTSIRLTIQRNMSTGPITNVHLECHINLPAPKSAPAPKSSLQ